LYGNLKQAAEGLGKTAYYGIKGVGNGILGLGRVGKQTYRYGKKSWSRMRYNQAKQRLRSCTTECDSLDECCTKEEIHNIERDIQARYDAFQKEEMEKRDHLMKEAENYAKHLPADEAKAFLDLASDQLLHDFLKATSEIKGGTRRSRRR
jgi:hypothetical protein